MKAIVFFLFILFTHVGLVAQTDFPALKQQFLDYRKANKQDSALFIARKMNQLSQQEQTDTSFWYGLSLGFMGKIYFGLNDIDSSIYCLKKSIQLIKYQSDTIDNDLVENYLILFDGLKSLNQFTEIEPLLIELIELYKELNDYASCFNLYYNLALLYKFKDD